MDFRIVGRFLNKTLFHCLKIRPSTKGDVALLERNMKRTIDQIAEAISVKEPDVPDDNKPGEIQGDEDSFPMAFNSSFDFDLPVYP